MMFAITLIPLLIGAGVAIDMLRAARVRTEVAESADAGLLAAIRATVLNSGTTMAQAEVIARRHFDAGMANYNDIVIDVFTLSMDPITERYSLTVEGRMQTTLMQVAGVEWMDIGTSNEAELAPPRSLEVALVLDNTYSMKGAKLDTLKSAADKLVDAIMADSDNTVKVGLVPFSQYVNIGLSRRDEVWLDVPDDYSEENYNPNYCYNTYPDSTRTCTRESSTCTRTRDGITETYSCTRSVCTGDLGDPVQICEPRTSTKTYTWRGCVGSRNYPFNVQDSGYDARKVPGLMNIWCAQEISPLTTIKSNVRSDINSMTVQGDQTYIPAGLVWGYRMLSSIEPLSEGITYTTQDNEDGIKAIILMTDGVNTKSAQYPFHTAIGAIGANKILAELCDEVKGDGIQIYTIAFEVLDSTVRDLLEDCASSKSKYYNATDSAALLDAFERIALNLNELALVK